MNKKTVIGLIAILLILIITTVIINLTNNSNNQNKDNNQGNQQESEQGEFHTEEITNIDEFYNKLLTKEKDIRKLGEEYSSEEAQKDNCFIIGAMVHNDNLYGEFMDKYKKKEDAFIRVVQTTVEGDVVITDILYDSKNDSISIVTDSTRDKFASEEDRIIKLFKYEKIADYKYKDHHYWLAYNGELNDDLFATDSRENMLIITLIN